MKLCFTMYFYVFLINFTILNNCKIIIICFACMTQKCKQFKLTHVIHDNLFKTFVMSQIGNYEYKNAVNNLIIIILVYLP